MKTTAEHAAEQAAYWKGPGGQGWLATYSRIELDISEALIAAARERRVDNATFVVGDAVTHPFKAQSCDLVFSRFGVMFFAEPVIAFANFKRALKPDGRMVFICWRAPQDNPWATVSLRAAQPFLPPLPRPGPEDPGQFAFGDRARVERILKEAGFARFAIEPHLGPQGVVLPGACWLVTAGVH